ncbi:tether containing UBX domain for GLUT4-like [Acanthaster planci]|uniref:Tether containing UBX domain for GLUT4-like n=1 Tax=Acanthaster planci TaxID=133434 RepID=A0A8B7YGG2_ACAPL|nr:tether containing UBX domain for GLUT4-like [Acanthaster planci]
MAATVNVLLPNGRRQNVKVTANTRILQVIENVCSKVGYNPDEHNLKHQRSILDPQLSVRYANLPNNCKLELVKADRPRTESAVCLALQTESGERLQREFPPATSLWDVLLHWETQNESMAGKLTASSQEADSGKSVHPVCIYLRQEIVGETWLRETTLKSLGLTSGKAIIRLIHRAVDLPAPPAQAAKATPATQMQQSTHPSPPAPQGQSTSASGGDTSMEAMELQKMDTEPGTSQASSQEDSDMKEMNLKAFEADARNKSTKPKPNVIQSEIKSLDSALPDSPQPMDVEETPKASQAAPVPSRNLEGNAGARPKQTQSRRGDAAPQQMPSSQLTPEMEQKANLMGAALAEAILKHRTEQQLAQLKQSWSAQLQSRPAFAEFKFPEKPSGHPPPLGLKQTSSQPPEPCERHPLVFSLDQVTGDKPVTGHDLPDEFFEVTVEDVQRMMADQQLQLSRMDEQHLQTRAMREANAFKKAKEYSKVAVRVHFPDRYILQGFFRPLELVKALGDFVRDHLQDPQTAFYLYTTPPRRILKDNSLSLFKAELFPAAVVHFGSEMGRDHYLREDLLSQLTSFRRATEEATSVIQRSISQDEAPAITHSSINQSVQLGPSSGASTSKASAPGKAEPPGPSKRQASGEAAANSKKIPKWFKMGKR